MAVHTSEGGTKIGLPNAMCLDRHVPDFLECLRCWLPRHFGEPHRTGQPWRLQCLDLSRNSLSDGSVIKVMDCLKNFDVRVECMWLAGNCVKEKGITAVTDYIWNCKDALVEIDLTDNQVFADPKAGPIPGADVVSALLRCLYNHSSYPLTIEKGRDGVKVLPLLLRMGGNAIRFPDKLLKQIRSKGGKQHVAICASSEPYPHTGQEYLSVCLPDFLVQKEPTVAQAAPAQNGHPARAEKTSSAPKAERQPAAGAAADGAKRKRAGSERGERKRRRDGRDRGDAAPRTRRRAAESQVAAKVASVAAVPAEQPPSTSAPEQGGTSEAPAEPDPGSEQDEDTTTVNNPEPGPEDEVDYGGDPDEQARGGSRSPSRSASRSAGAAARGRGGRGPHGGGRGPRGRSPPGQVLKPREKGHTAADQKRLQEQVDARLKTMEGLPSEQSTREMLAEFVVCMVVAKKSMSDIEVELETFLGTHTKSFTEWLGQLEPASSRGAGHHQ